MKKRVTYGVAFSPEDIAYYENRRKKKRVHIILLVLTYLVLTIWAVVALFPMLWTLIGSMRLHFQIIKYPLSFNFAQWSFDNYNNLFATPTFNIWKSYWNTIYVSVLIVIGTLIVSIMMAFCLARIKFFGSKACEILVIACMMFPAFALLTPLYVLFNKINLIDTHIGIILPQIALNMSFTTILLTGFFKSLPLEVEESAFLDGASVPRILIQIVLPMMKSALITCVIFVFLWSYNDLFIQSFVLRSNDKRLIPYVLKSASNMAGSDFGKACAAATIVALPMLIIYFFLQKNIIKGLTAGAVKG